MREDGDRIVILHPWDDSSVSFDIAKKDQKMKRVLSKVVLPPQLYAIYHIEDKAYEFIYTITSDGDQIWNRAFDFIYKEHILKCRFASSSETLLELAKIAKYHESNASTNYRNLRIFTDYLQQKDMPEPIREFFGSRKPISFFVESITSHNAEFINDLARHLNFYMYYFDRRTPRIIIHKPESPLVSKSNKIVAPPFPKEIRAPLIDTYMLDLWSGASEAKGRLRYIYIYQMLEYAAFYYLDEQVRSRVARLLRRPDLAFAIDDCLPRLVDHIVDYRQSDEQKLTSVIQGAVEPKEIWTVLDKYHDFFSKEQSFDGGFSMCPFIRDSWNAEDFSNAWIPKLPDSLRKIRNALVHSRESRLGLAIAPTKANSRKLEPWTEVLEETACQVAVFREA